MTNTLNIQLNKELNRWELHFSQVPDGKLSDYLVRLGYRFSQRKPRLFHAPKQNAYKTFGEDLKIALQENTDYTDILIKPSHPPHKSNIIHGKFSYVTISHRTPKSTGKKNFIIFDQYRKIAEVIAEQYGERVYGEKLISVEATPRVEKGKAKKLLEKNKVINPLKAPQGSIAKKEATQKTIAKDKKKSLTNTRGVYTKETAGDRYENLIVPIPKNAQFEVTIDLVKDENNHYRFGLSIQKNFGDHSSTSSPVSNTSATYPTKKEALQIAFGQIVSRIQSQIGKEDYIISDQNKKNRLLKKALEATIAFAKELKIPLELKEMEKASNIKKPTAKKNKKTTPQKPAKVNSQKSKDTQPTAQPSKNNLRKMVKAIVNQLQELADQTDTLHNRALIETERIQFTDALAVKEQETFRKELQRIIGEQQYWIKKLDTTLLQERYASILKPLTTFLGQNGQGHEDAIETSQKKEKKNAAVASKTTVTNKDRFTIKTINPFGFDIPNVQIPMGIPSPFDAGGIRTMDIGQLFKKFPRLAKINNKTVKEASALELFQLAQLDISKLKVHKDLFRKEWAKRGESIFQDLGFPMDVTYPYVSIVTGYINVDSLETILNNDYGYSSWLWLAIEYRPIANPLIGIQEIDTQLVAYKAQLKKDFEDWKASVTPNRSMLEKQIAATKEIIQDLKASKKVIQDYLSAPTELVTSENLSNIEVQQPKLVTPNATSQFVSLQEAERIRRQFKAKGFTLPYTGIQAFVKNVSLAELATRSGYIQMKLDTKIAKEYRHWIDILEKEINILEKKNDKKSKQSKTHRLERIAALQREADDLAVLVNDEDKIFRDELFVELVARVRKNGYVIGEDDIAGFRKSMMQELFEGTMLETHPDMSIGKAVRILTDKYFPKEKENSNGADVSYMDKVIAIMHDHYMEARRLSRKKVEEIKELANVPNLGMLWEAVELSWLLWYKSLYQQRIPFDIKLQSMTAFWDQVQPSYDYSDSSKELYKQYSTPCPIGAMIAEYTHMKDAERTFEPSAGNGLLVLGADPQKTHVNEIDKNRRNSLEKQGFHTITHFNAAEPFPEGLEKSFDVMVTNPPFATWDADDFDKKRIVQKYFNSYRRLDKNRLRLEHVMSGLALHTLKDSGKAALILMGHLYFDDQGFIAKARPFFNWLYMHYRVDDVINLNGFTLYNKQGATPKTMLVLISGRKRNPTNKSIAPTRKQAASLDAVVDTFEALWKRVKSHIKTPLEILIQKLKIEIEDDIL